MYASLKSLKPWLSSRKNARRLTVLLCLASTVTSLSVYLSCSSLPRSLLLPMLNLAALISVWIQHRGSRASINFQPQELADRLLEVQENERHRLSRELHDDIGQLLTAAKLQTQWLLGHLPETLRNHCADLSNILDETLTKVRDVSAILNPRQLASLGLEASLRAHLLKTLGNTTVNWSLECQQRLTGLSEEMAVTAFRLAQEAVTNMLRHAQADNLLIRLKRLPEGLSIHIADDGLGFSPVANPSEQGQRGMAGMAERVEQLGGTLTITSGPGKGTQIDALLPWAPRALERASTNKVL
ncbi:sensor histidine kinase [Pseudomonas agarici]|uniref:sensor histidine kinase n=1 Tax=Pseudomonas agarici TaxID=46677 RepID=UPI000309B99F|nr:sensor histidine kinase [Pseudomonas agarici]NWB92803.1 sensor histidine kinase [Pseudomonas agarici]NWC09070.1 sensor histidine kinase [Pseudomonas agarici]SEK35513.1 Signal transduction histidine kinase [Pseudomonas agarici]